MVGRRGRVTGDGRRTGRRSWLGWAIGGAIAVVVVAWLGLCAYRLVQADRYLRSAISEAQQLRSHLSTQELTNGGATPQLREAAAKFRDAHGILEGALLAPLRLLPVVGRQLHSAIDLSGAAGTVATDGSQALDQVHTLLNAPHDSPPRRAALVTQLSGVVTKLDAQVSSVNLGPSNGLIGTLASKRNTFATDLAKLQSQLARAKGATGALAGLLNSPRTYLVFSANNAEMRAGSGMFLSAGTLHTGGGQLTLGAFTPTSLLTLPTPSVPLTGDLAHLWGFTEPNQEFRNLALSPQFPANAALAAQMWQARTGQRVDGVLVLDVGALSDILSATGPVRVGGQTYDAQTVIPYLLNGQYQGLSSDDQAQAARHQRDGQLAAAAFDSLSGGGAKLGTLGTALQRAADGRHVLAWASDPAVEAQWQAAGVGGSVAPTDMLLSVLNQGANKLDPFLNVTSALQLAPAGADTTVTVTVTVHNGTPAGQPGYVAGDAGKPKAPGTYAGAVELDFPGSAGGREIANHLSLSAAGPDGLSYAMAVPVQVRPNGTAVVVFRFVLGARSGTLRVDPSARMPATQWTVKGPGPALSFTDDVAHQVNW